MKCYTEEIFGPVLVSLSVDTLDDVSYLLTTLLVYTVLHDISECTVVQFGLMPCCEVLMDLP